MGRGRRAGFILTWFIGDHAPRHVPVQTSDGKPVGRLDLKTRLGMGGLHPARRLLQIIKQLENEGRL